MWLILILTIGQAASSTLAWIGFYAGVRALPGARARQSRWIIDSAVVAAAWLVGVFLLGAADVFRNGALPPRIPMALAATLLPHNCPAVAESCVVCASRPAMLSAGCDYFRLIFYPDLAQFPC